MVKKLFTRFLSTASLVALSSLNVLMAQATTTITTAFTNNPGILRVGNIGAPQFITFNVTNSNTCPITITDLSWYHIGELVFNPGNITHSMNGAVYTLWHHQTSITGAPTVSIANNWIVDGVSNAISNGTSPGVIFPILTGLNVTVPPGQTYRFALSSTDTMAFFVNVNPFTFVNNGVTVTASPSYWGAMPGPGVNVINPGAFIPAFCGSITFKNAGVAPPASPVFTANSVKICKNGDLVLTANVPAYITNPVFVFKDPGGITINGSGNTRTITNMQPNQSGVYTVTVSDPNCGGTPSLPSSLNITVVNPPAPGIEGKTDFCLNEPFLPVNVLGTGVKWYYSKTGGSAIPFTPPFNTTTINEDTFYVSQTVGGCESEERTMVVYRASAKPAPPIVTTPLFYCENAPSVPLTANGSQLKWYYDPIGGIPSTIAPTPNTTAKDTFNYYVTQSNRGCESNRAPIKVVITFKPNGLVLATKEKLCETDTLTLNYYGSAFPGSAYNWTFPTGTTILQNDVNFAGPIQIKLDSAGLRDIKLQVGNDGCYSDMYIKTIRVDTLPTANIEIRPNICQGQVELISLISYTQSADSFFWDFDGGVTSHYSTDQGPYGVTWSTAGKKTVKLRLVNKLCSNTIPDSTIVHAKPDATFKMDGALDKVYCNGDSIKMTANTISASSTYSWTPTRFFDNYSNNASAFARIDFTSPIKLSVTDEYGCFNSDSIKVTTKPCCDVTFPSAFSPNGDGKNDQFRLVQTYMQIKNGQQRQIDVRSFKIVNRYGQVVFETADELKGWDGNLNGKPQDVGSYFYYISYKCDGKMMENKGELILVR